MNSTDHFYHAFQTIAKTTAFGNRLFPIKNELEPLSHLPYDQEVMLKEQTLRHFLEKHLQSDTLKPLIQSPKPRMYRTTSKRRVFVVKNTTFFKCSPHSILPRSSPIEHSQLEPTSHQTIYQTIYKLLQRHDFFIIAKGLNYVIVRGTYTEHLVIFNIRSITGTLVRKIRQLCSHLREERSDIIACFLYVDPSQSDYYLEQDQPEKQLTTKKLFGFDFFYLTLKQHNSIPSLSLPSNEIKYCVHPFSFSQINESILPQFIGSVQAHLSLKANKTLLDLFCGYGLFSLALRHLYGNTLGIDSCHHSIEAAKKTARMLHSSNSSIFKPMMISGDNLKRLIKPSIPYDMIIDPPYHGVSRQTISVLANHQFETIIHICCNINEVPHTIKLWKEQKYHTKALIPCDMFAGTLHLETIIVLKKGTNE